MAVVATPAVQVVRADADRCISELSFSTSAGQVSVVDPGVSGVAGVSPLSFPAINRRLADSLSAVLVLTALPKGSITGVEKLLGKWARCNGRGCVYVSRDSDATGLRFTCVTYMGKGSARSEVFQYGPQGDFVRAECSESDRSGASKKCPVATSFDVNDLGARLLGNAEFIRVPIENW